MSRADELSVPGVAGAFNVVIREMRQNERALEQAISERDAAEECLSQIYYLVTGRSPEWSNLFGHKEALEEIGDAVAALKGAVQAAR